MMKRNIQTSAFLMRFLGWWLVPVMIALIFSYPHGFLWGIEQNSGWNPYIFMLIAMYVAWCYLLVREAKNPRGAGLLFDYGIVSSILHALVMTVQTLMMLEHEMPHMWADIPLLFVIAWLLWYYHPKRVASDQ